MFTIDVQLIGERILIPHMPVLAKDTVETAVIAFDFDDKWDGYTKTAMFWGTDDEEYAVEVVNDSAVIPREVLAEAGQIKFGVYGVNGSKRIVSVKTPYKVIEGAYTANK